ncbi:MAG: lysine--tRNA ligase [Alphaproteobacteria bacterium CG_4_10_14_0_8_um_filter_53_9]|nr:MAG: lysine--tRNA ligase [Alphaproteobacteria bacterium CG_4_10_14_0_8_um_filter_53_9]
MTEHSELIAQRRSKLTKLREENKTAYPNTFQPSSTAAALHAAYPTQTREELAEQSPVYKLAGRVMNIRAFGKLTFIKLVDDTGHIQLSASLDVMGEEAFKALDTMLDLGDIIGVEGKMTRTNKGELTLQIEKAHMLAKCLQPLPDKWHGLENIEQRYRQRYVDLLMNPEVKDVFVKRSKMIRAIREYLDNSGFLEVETPILQVLAGGTIARPFDTHHNALDMPLKLRIAPELFLKRLLVGGFTQVYELSRNFRNEGVSTKHNPEFTMLEWYSAYGTRESMMEIMEGLLRHAAEKTLGTLQVPYGEDEIVDLAPPFTRLTMKDAVVKYTDTTAAELESMEGLTTAALRNGLKADKIEGLGYGELLQTLFEHKVEEQLIQPTFITEYPMATSPLTREDPENPGWTQRSELYIIGREHGELYSELNDPDDQRKRLEDQRAKAAAGDAEAMPFDEDFLNALEIGMPPAGGVGLGIDRLAMFLTNQPSIRDVLLFPLQKPKPQE